MTGYVKLFSSILDSTIWREADHVRLIWITMLAMADKDSVVEASIPGLADRAKVTIEQCSDALKRLSEPDEYSRTQDFDGRRIEQVGGGWFLLNHGKYRDIINLQERRAQNAERQKRYRERNASRRVTQSNAMSHDVTPPTPTPTPTPSPEEEVRTPKPPRGIKKSQVEKPAEVSDQLWSDFVAHRKSKRAAVTNTAIEGIRSEANKAGLTLSEALTMCCAQGWQGFKSSWVEKSKKTPEIEYD